MREADDRARRPRRLFRQGMVIAVTALAVIGVGGTLAMRWRGDRAAAGQAPVAKTEVAIELAPGDLVVAGRASLGLGLPISGSLRAFNAAFVKARAPGELQGLVVREGDRVAAGQVIARTDAAEYQARLRQAQQTADAARVQIDIAKRQLDNNQALVNQGFISRTALDTSQNNLTSADANHQAALAMVDVARKALDDTVLRAPIAGTVAQRLAQPGERVGPDTRVVEIVDLSRLELEATLAAADSLRVATGQKATLRVEGSGRPIEATVARINPSAQAGSRGVVVYLTVSGTEGLRQGLFAQGTLSTGATDALAVPLSSVRTDKPQPYVQAVENGRVVHRTVTLGPRGDTGGETMVAIEQGIAAGTSVLRGNLGLIRDGTAVRVTGVTGGDKPIPASATGGGIAPAAPSTPRPAT